MSIPRSHPRRAVSAPQCGSRHLCFNKTSQWFRRWLKFENQWFRDTQFFPTRPNCGMAILCQEWLQNLIVCIKKQIQLRKFEDLIGFMKWFMNRATSHLARIFQEVTWNGKLLSPQGWGKEVMSWEKKKAHWRKVGVSGDKTCYWLSYDTLYRLGLPWSRRKPSFLLLGW